MVRSRLRKFLSCLILVAFLAISMAGFCQSTHAAGLADGIKSDRDAITAVDGHCPSCPVDDHSAPDNDSSCHCPCHAPLTVQSFRVACPQSASSLLFFESFKAPPEVFLSKYVPPHIPA